MQKESPQPPQTPQTPQTPQQEEESPIEPQQQEESPQSPQSPQTQMEEESQPQTDIETLEEQTRIELLSKGNYTCKQKQTESTTNEPKYQQVLQMKNEITENAKKISDIIKTIPQYNLYFQPIIDQEDIQLGKLTEDNIEECEEQNIPKQINTSNFISLKTRYYRETWQENIQKIKKQYPTKTLQIFLDTMQNMIQILKYLKSKDIVHFNINKKTMLVSDIRKTPVLSNFNLSFKLEDLKKDEIENLFPSYEEYAPWPIEVYLASQIANAKEQNQELEIKLVEKEEMDNWIDAFTQSPIYQRIASEERRELIQIQLTQYFQPIIQKPFKTLYENLIESAKTWDTYSMCILWLDTFIFLELNKKMEEYNFIRDFIELMKTIVYANPNARPSIEYIENAIYEIFLQISNEKYQKFISDLVEAPSEKEPEPKLEDE
jgi:hypothetical protein